MTWLILSILVPQSWTHALTTWSLWASCDDHLFKDLCAKSTDTSSYSRHDIIPLTPSMRLSTDFMSNTATVHHRSTADSEDHATLGSARVDTESPRHERVRIRLRRSPRPGMQQSLSSWFTPRGHQRSGTDHAGRKWIANTSLVVSILLRLVDKYIFIYNYFRRFLLGLLSMFRLAA